MIKFTILSLLVSIALALPIAAQAGEVATYVGGGRYVGEGDSVPDAVIRQRSNEYPNASVTVKIMSSAMTVLNVGSGNMTAKASRTMN